MPRVLHLVKGGDSSLLRATVEAQLAAGDTVSVALLHGASLPSKLPATIRVQHVPDDLLWDALLERIFESDQVITW